MYEQPLSYEQPPLTPHEKLREEAMQGKMVSRLLKDFRLSFRYSGSEWGQDMLMYLLGFQYFQAGQPVQDTIAECLSTVDKDQWQRAALPPKEHGALADENHLARESANEWRKFQDRVHPDRIVRLVDDMQKGEIDHYGDIVLQLAHHMIRKDQKYIGNDGGGRPLRSSIKKAFASFVREYALAGSSTGSPTLNAVFQDMRQAIIVCPPFEMNRLATMWQNSHGGSEFYPDDFLKAAQAAGTRDQFDYYPLHYNDSWEYGGRKLPYPHDRRV